MASNCRCCKLHFDCCICWISNDLNFTKCFSEVPQFVPATWADWISTAGKGDTGNKSWKFFKEGYIHDIYVGLRDLGQASGSTVTNVKPNVIRARCHRSMKKNEEPHNVYISFEKGKNRAKLISGHCSCKAGSGGHCNHVFALLFQLNDFSSYGISEIPVGSTCTSKPQQWHIPRSTNITPLPVMATHFANAVTDKKDDSRKKDPVRCKLYDARGFNVSDGLSASAVDAHVTYLKKLAKPPPFSYLLMEQDTPKNIKTVFGNVPVGSCLSYQLFDCANLTTQFKHSLDFFPNFSDIDNQMCKSFPKLPADDLTIHFDLDCVSCVTQKDWFNENISISIEDSHVLQKRTVMQYKSAEWQSARKKRLTASNFGKVLARKKPPTEAMFKDIYGTKDLSKVASIQHGLSKEKEALSIYIKQMKRKIPNFCVFDSGLVVNPKHPHLGCTPDGKVFNPALKPCFGLLEIKCPMTQRGKKVEEIVKSHDFYIELKDNSEEYILKREHKFGYFTQVQGQMALTGLKWCDFIVYLSDSNEMIATRVPFDEEYWTVIALPKLNSFFIKSIPFLMS